MAGAILAGAGTAVMVLGLATHLFEGGSPKKTGRPALAPLIEDVCVPEMREGKRPKAWMPILRLAGTGPAHLPLPGTHE